MLMLTHRMVRRMICHVRFSAHRSIWNFASAHSLVIVTANVPPGPGQRVDIEILDGSEKGNVYLSKRVRP
jgi:hypothetical protein